MARTRNISSRCGKRHILPIAAFLAVTAASGAAKEDTPATGDEARHTSHWLTNPFGDMLKPVNDLGVGTFSGKLQFLGMRRSFDDEDFSGGTLAGTIRYRSPAFHGIRAGLEYIYTPELFEGGTIPPQRGGAWAVLNDDFHVWSEAWVDIGLDVFGLEKTTFRVGRQKSTYEFAPSFPIRQKAQYIEAAVFSFKEIEHFSLDLGHIETFSSWSGRFRKGDWLQADFNRVEDIIADYENDERIESANTGMQFISVHTDAIDGLDITVYDLCGCSLYNTIGAQANVTLFDRKDWSLTWNNHYIMQRDVGSFPLTVDSDVIESSLAFKWGDFVLQPGVISTFGGNDRSNDFRHPFESNLTWEYTLLWNTRAHLAGSDTFYLKSTYTFGDSLLYFLGMTTCHEDNVNFGSTDYEFDVIFKHSFTDNISATVKAGWGTQNHGRGDSPERSDLRLFVTYSF